MINIEGSDFLSNHCSSCGNWKSEILIKLQQWGQNTNSTKWILKIPKHMWIWKILGKESNQKSTLWRKAIGSNNFLTWIPENHHICLIKERECFSSTPPYLLQLGLVSVISVLDTWLQDLLYQIKSKGY